MSTLKNAEINAKDVNCSAKTAFQQKLKEMSNIITWQNLFKLLPPLPFFFFFWPIWKPLSHLVTVALMFNNTILTFYETVT